MSEIATRDGATLVRDVSQEAFWRENFPDMTLFGHDAQRSLVIDTSPDPQAQTLLSARMREEGYFQHRNETLDTLAPILADAVRTCVRLDIPPAFIFLFDETWTCFQALYPMLSAFLGEDYRMLPDFWAWHVDPKAGQAGWAPHRDKGGKALAPDGSPLSLTVWIPLSEATPLTSCMYVLPANRDPNYNTPNEGTHEANLASVRALPGTPGDYFCWNQAVLHWGSESSPFAPHPRLSMALEFQRGDIPAFNNPLLVPFETLDFDARLKLIGKQILQYRHMYPLAARFEALAHGLTGR